MANFNQANRSYARQDFGGRSSNRASMHPAICSSCGKKCEVPFKPSGNKPVYCSECFENNGGSSSKRYEDRSAGKSNFKGRQVFDAVCDKCGNKCTLPFLPTSGKPIYCNSCFEEKNAKGNRNPEQHQYKEQFEALNSKLDKIIKLLTPRVSAESVPVEKLVLPKKAVVAKKKLTKKKSSAKKVSD
jgi:CxxC-x17-CxxC domain-containing protein